MKFFTSALLLVALCALVALAEPEPKPAKVSRFRAAQTIGDDVKKVDEFDHEDTLDAEKEVAAANDASKKGDSSSGRLFMKKFMMFKNMFSQNQKQPIIPIIITGGGGTGTVSPTGTTPPTSTTTFTSTGSIPTASGTITTGPATGTDGGAGGGADAGAGGGADGGAGGGAGGPNGRIQFYGRDSTDEDNTESVENPLADEQSVAAALAAGGEEYVVTDQDIKGTSDAKALRGPARVNLKRRGAKRGQVVTVRIPAKYRQYFKNGQRVILNKNNKKGGRPVRRRVIRRGPNRRRIKNNKKNKRRRIVAA